MKEDVEEMRQYLKTNMAEGYLADEEEDKIDEFVDAYKELSEKNKSIQKIVRKAYESKVQ